MARKTLLTEGEIRQFMKLASLTPLGAGRLQEMGCIGEDKTANKGHGPGKQVTDGNGHPTGRWLKEQEDEEMEMGAEEAPMGEPGLEPGLEGGEEELDVGIEDELGAEEDVGAGEPGMVSVEDFMAALESALEEVTGEPVSTEVDDELGAEEEGEEELGGELGMEPEGDLEMGMGAGEEEGEELPGMRDMYEGNEEKIVNEVAQRVVARLTREKKNTNLADQLAEKILKRITSK